MSLIFGIFNRNQEPINPKEFKLMYKALEKYPHEKYNYKIQGNIAFGHLLTHNTPESVYEKQPSYLDNQKILFVSEGRIDNRLELFSKLGINKLEKDKVSDGELILQAYLKWGKHSVNHLLGDWSFAAFNKDEQKLFLARDHHGYTALNYYISDRFVIFSSSIKAILTLKNIDIKLNKDKLIELISCSNIGTNKNESFFKNIYNLGPAHALEINQDSFNLQRYWYPETIKLSENKSLEDHIDNVSSILNTAIKDRLRSKKPVSSMLSGGFDSGTVSYLAAELLAKENKKLTTFSHVPLFKPTNLLEKGWFGNEKPFIEEIVQSSGNILPNYIDSKEISPLSGAIKLIDILSMPIHAAINSYWLVDILQNSAKANFGILLSGEMGNATISYAGIYNRLNSRTIYKTKGLKVLIKLKVLRPMVFNFFDHQFRKYKQKKMSIYDYSYINQKAVRDLNLLKLMKENDFDPSFTFNFSNAKSEQLAILMTGYNSRCYSGANLGNYFGIEMRDPTADKRVVEYFASIPNEVFFDSKGKNKQLIRKMMEDKLPRSIIESKTKGKQSSDIGMRLLNDKNYLDQLIFELEKVDLFCELVDLPRIKKEWQKVKNTTNNNFDIDQIHHMFRAIMIGYFIKENIS